MVLIEVSFPPPSRFTAQATEMAPTSANKATRPIQVPTIRKPSPAPRSLPLRKHTAKVGRHTSSLTQRPVQTWTTKTTASLRENILAREAPRPLRKPRGTASMSVCNTDFVNQTPNSPASRRCESKDTRTRSLGWQRTTISNVNFKCHCNQKQKQYIERKSLDVEWVKKHMVAQKGAYHRFHDRHPDAALQA